MKIICTADLHGHLPPIDFGDLLVVAGDLSPGFNASQQIDWLNGSFSRWMKMSSCKKKICIAGNHDYGLWLSPGLGIHNDYVYLRDAQTEFEGYKIWGTPWTLRYGNYYFQGSEAELDKNFRKIPGNTDIIISHTPPYGFGDMFEGEKLGSKSLLENIKRVKPKLVICGHIHSGYGIYEIDQTLLVNCSLCNDKNIPTKYPISIII